ADLTQVTDKLDKLKKWTVTTYKTTKQSVFEQLGKVDKTVDKELETKIDDLRELHRRYKEVSSTAQAFATHLTQTNTLQRSLAEAMYQLSLREDSLKTDLSMGDTLRSVCHNGDQFLRSLGHFTSSLQTLCDKTFEDTLMTIQQHDQARLEFDVCRHELILLQQNPSATRPAIEEKERSCNEAREKYDRTKEDVRVKMALLEEHRIDQMRKQLSEFHRTMAEYYSGNAKALDSAAYDLADANSSAKRVKATLRSSFLES
ncbi:Arfaptin-like domain containing protein, partial [Aphelenchoides avenae]